MNNGISKLLLDVNCKEVADLIEKELQHCFMRECAEYCEFDEYRFCVNHDHINVIVYDADEEEIFEFFIERYGIEYSTRTDEGYKNITVQYNATEEEFNSSELVKYLNYDDLEIARQVRARYRKFLVL